jgi:hypothetical protein
MGRLSQIVSAVLVVAAVTASGASAATKTLAKKPAATKKVVKKAAKKKPAARKKQALVKPLTAVDGKMTAPGAFKIMNGVACGRIGGIWRPGTVTKLGRFQTFTLQASTAKKLAAQTKGAKRKAWQKKAARFLAQDTTGRAICQQTASYMPYPTPGLPSYGGYVPPAQAPVRFDLSGAVGVASGTGLTGAVATRSGHTLRSAISSNLAVVDRAGHLRDAVTTGNVTVGQFLIAPSNKLYVLFNGQTFLNGGGTTSEKPCLLAVIDRATGIPTCVDDSLGSISWNTGQGNGNAAIQFDDTGAVYYMGYTTDGRMVLRRSSNGIRRDLVTDYASASDFVVLGDGTVVLSGSTYATGAAWLRRISPQGSLQTLRTAQSSFLREFPDGNVYFGASSNVLRYLPSTDALDPAAWIGYPTGSYYPAPDAAAPHNDVTTLCGYSSGQDNSAFCNSNGASVMKTFTTGDGKVFVINGWGPNGQLMQYYPSVVRPTTEVTRVAVAQGGTSSLVLSGLNRQDKNVTTLFDTSDGSERELIGPDPEFEVYHVNYLSDSTTVMFDGLRFSDNSYILGTVDLTTGTVTASTPLAGKLTAFETFR